MGKKRTFGAGEILLMEDTDGKCHKTRNLQETRRKFIFVPLEKITKSDGSENKKLKT